MDGAYHFTLFEEFTLPGRALRPSTISLSSEDCMVHEEFETVCKNHLKMRRSNSILKLKIMNSCKSSHMRLYMRLCVKLCVI